MRLAQQLRPAILSVLVLTLLAGGVFPLVLFAIAAPLFPYQTGGSLTVRGGAIVGSRLIGQDFTRPEWFQPRPSAAGDGYDGTASGGTNLSPNNPKLKEGALGFAGVRTLAAQYRQRNGLASDTAIPIDAVTRSGSGLDPDISPANAFLQVARVARARKLKESVVRRLVSEHVVHRSSGSSASRAWPCWSSIWRSIAWSSGPRPRRKLRDEPASAVSNVYLKSNGRLPAEW